MSLKPGVAGLSAAGVTVILLFAWCTFENWYVFGSAFTDLPGQDSIALVNKLEWPVCAAVALLAGRLVGIACQRRRWIGALVGVLPLNLLFLVSAQEHWLRIWPLYSGACALALAGAYFDVAITPGVALTPVSRPTTR